MLLPAHLYCDTTATRPTCNELDEANRSDMAHLANTDLCLVIHPSNTAVHNPRSPSNPLHPQPLHLPLHPLLHQPPQWTNSIDLRITGTIPRRCTLLIPLSSLVASRVSEYDASEQHNYV